MMRRRGRPGLVGLAARTAVVAGTATAVNNGMNNRQQAKAQDQWEQEQYQAAQQQAAMNAAAQQAVAQQMAAAPAPAARARGARGSSRRRGRHRRVASEAGGAPGCRSPQRRRVRRGEGPPALLRQRRHRPII